MIINRGRYLAAHGRADRAEAAFREVLSIDPENEVARALLTALESRESDGVGGGAGR
jgi:predicted TPR repeat methyltransferase